MQHNSRPAFEHDITKTVTAAEIVRLWEDDDHQYDASDFIDDICKLVKLESQDRNAIEAEMYDRVADHIEVQVAHLKTPARPASAFAAAKRQAYDVGMSLAKEFRDKATRRKEQSHVEQAQAGP